MLNVLLSAFKVNNKGNTAKEGDIVLVAISLTWKPSAWYLVDEFIVSVDILEHVIFPAGGTRNRDYSWLKSFQSCSNDHEK